MIRVVGGWDFSNVGAEEFNAIPQKRNCPLVRIFLARRLFGNSILKIEGDNNKEFNYEKGQREDHQKTK